MRGFLPPPPPHHPSSRYFFHHFIHSPLRIGHCFFCETYHQQMGLFPSYHPIILFIFLFIIFILLPIPSILPMSATHRRRTSIEQIGGGRTLRDEEGGGGMGGGVRVAEGKGLNALEEEQALIHQLLHSEHNAARELYDWRVRPRGSLAVLSEHQWSGDFEIPVLVDVNIYLRSISKVDDVNMEFTMHFTFRQEWTDERLLFHSPTLDYIVLVSSGHSQRIFLPDTFFQNEKDGRKHDVDKPNVFIRVYNGTGRVLYSSRMTLTLSCPMHLQAYPLDTQTCFIDYASYAYTTKDLEYRWKARDPIQIKPGLRQSLPSFVLSSVTTGNCTSVTNTGTYSCLRTILRLRREFSYYLLQLYVPSFMLVAVSTVSFWLDKDSVPARITLGTTVLLTVTTMASGINAKLPPVSYTKSVDIWIGVCTGFIFAALLEFSLVNWAARKEAFSQAKSSRVMTNPLLSAIYHRREHQRRLSAMDAAAYGTIIGGGSARQFRSPSAFSSISRKISDGGEVGAGRHAGGLLFCCCPALCEWWEELWTVRYRENSRRIDLLARALFPLCFIVFNIIYWTCYLRPYLAEDVDEQLAGQIVWEIKEERPD